MRALCKRKCKNDAMEQTEDKRDCNAIGLCSTISQAPNHLNPDPLSSGKELSSTSLLGLPAEVRNSIYALLLPETVYARPFANPRRVPSSTSNDHVAILYTCHKVYEEVLSLYLGTSRSIVDEATPHYNDTSPVIRLGACLKVSRLCTLPKSKDLNELR